jgi:hypothetical protein
VLVECVDDRFIAQFWASLFRFIVQPTLYVSDPDVALRVADTMLRQGLSSLFACSSQPIFVGSMARMAGSLPKPRSDHYLPTITEGRQAFDGDLRSTSALGLADGITGHTEKWLQARLTFLPGGMCVSQPEQARAICRATQPMCARRCSFLVVAHLLVYLWT